MDSPQFMVKLKLLPMGVSDSGDLAHEEGAAQGCPAWGSSLPSGPGRDFSPRHFVEEEAWGLSFLAPPILLKFCPCKAVILKWLGPMRSYLGFFSLKQVKKPIRF